MVAMAAPKRTHVNTSNNGSSHRLPSKLSLLSMFCPFAFHISLCIPRSLALSLSQSILFHVYLSSSCLQTVCFQPYEPYMLYVAACCTFKKTTKNWVRYCDGINFELNKSHECERIQFILSRCISHVGTSKFSKSPSQWVYVCVSYSTLCVPYAVLLISRFRSLCLSVCLSVSISLNFFLLW